VKAGFVAGAEGDKGVMFSPDGKAVGYYTIRAVSDGHQACERPCSKAMS
jgi:hypothetical protein